MQSSTSAPLLASASPLALTVSSPRRCNMSGGNTAWGRRGPQARVSSWPESLAGPPLPVCAKGGISDWQ